MKFTLTVGINDHHPKVPFDLRFREKVETRLLRAGLGSRWECAAVTVTFDLENGTLEPDLISNRVNLVLEEAVVCPEALHHIHLYGEGRLFPTPALQSFYSKEGSMNFYLGSISHTNESHIGVFPINFPKGLDHVLTSFQSVAEWFTLLMTMMKRAKNARRLIEENHNIKGGLDKLDDLTKMFLDLPPLLGRHWNLAASK